MRAANPNTKFRTLNTASVRSMSELEGLTTGADVAAHQAELKLAEQEAAAIQHGERRAIEQVIEAQPTMLARKDGRTRPNRVKKQVFVRTRALKLKHRRPIKKVDTKPPRKKLRPRN